MIICAKTCIIIYLDSVLLFKLCPSVFRSKTNDFVIPFSGFTDDNHLIFCAQPRPVIYRFHTSTALTFCLPIPFYFFNIVIQYRELNLCFGVIGGILQWALDHSPFVYNVNERFSPPSGRRKFLMKQIRYLTNQLI